MRNTKKLVSYSSRLINAAVENNLMQVSIIDRDEKQVTLPTGQKVVEFINCSYLGLDTHPKVVAGSKNVDPSWGVHFCCARSRFSIEPNRVLEEALSSWFGGRAITFPSVTTAHMSTLPLLASGVLIDHVNPPKVRMIFDRFAHASMQYLKPILAQEAEIETIRHNDMEQLRERAIFARNNGEIPVYLADGVYSMGGVCPLKEVIEIADETGMFLYIDDAHATSILGDKGEGLVLDYFNAIGQLPDNVICNFSLAKGFGCNGGGVILPNKKLESLVRSFGQTYAFSAPLDFTIVQASLAALELHKDGTVNKLQKKLRKNVALLDDCLGIDETFSPIRMVKIGDEVQAIEIGKQLIENGFYASVVFFPVVAKGNAQLRLCVSVDHTEEEIVRLCDKIKLLTKRTEKVEELLTVN